jgi:hypothetical protein
MLVGCDFIGVQLLGYSSIEMADLDDLDGCGGHAMPNAVAVDVAAI